MAILALALHGLLQGLEELIGGRPFAAARDPEQALGGFPRGGARGAGFRARLRGLAARAAVAVARRPPGARAAASRARRLILADAAAAAAGQGASAGGTIFLRRRPAVDGGGGGAALLLVLAAGATLAVAAAHRRRGLSSGWPTLVRHCFEALLLLLELVLALSASLPVSGGLAPRRDA